MSHASDNKGRFVRDARWCFHWTLWVVLALTVAGAYWLIWR